MAALLTSADLAALMGRPVDSQQGAAVLSIVAALARSYTRGEGFTVDGPCDEIRAVILGASLRLLAHPRQIQMSESAGPESASYATGFTGWTIPERAVLDSFRVVALG
jgi:hypothetical protein